MTESHKPKRSSEKPQPKLPEYMIRRPNESNADFHKRKNKAMRDAEDAQRNRVMEASEARRVQQAKKNGQRTRKASKWSKPPQGA